jgi:hypothetical protein
MKGYRLFYTYKYTVSKKKKNLSLTLSISYPFKWIMRLGLEEVGLNGTNKLRSFLKLYRLKR